MNRAVILDVPTRRWQCPSCLALHETREARVHVPMHPCPKLHGVVAPYVELHATAELAKSATRHVVKEREDYIGDEVVRTDGTGRPVMAVVTERADGSNDCHAFAGTASGHQS
jgi:uncharacterized protein YodC (DUF2158 family)